LVLQLHVVSFRRFAVAARLMPTLMPWCFPWPPTLQYKDVDSIINHNEINAALESTKKASQDPVAIKAILEAAKERSFLTNYTPGAWFVAYRVNYW
jgi:hypothetical protein